MKLIEKNNKKGITLIALVITIIVLLILAGVSIAMLTGDNSLLGNAQKTGSINTTEDYTGYYADTDGNPNTVEGIIFADLAHNGSGTWKDDDGDDSYGYYSYLAATSELKEYYISKESYTDKNTGYGTTGVISAKKGTSGTERFYVMSLSDFDNSTYYWYYSAVENDNGNGMSDYGTYTSEEFGKGKENTQNMITKWNDYGYGAQNDNDMWKLIQDKCKQGWFVPSFGEWSAFAVMLQGKGLTTSNYSNKFGLQSEYWSSWQCTTDRAWTARFGGGFVSYNYVNDVRYVRLASTF